MSSDPNYRPNAPHQSPTQRTNFSSNVGMSANIRPNINTRPSLPMPPIPPSQLQHLLFQPPSLNQHNGQQAPRHPPPQLPRTHHPPPHLQSHLQSPHLPPTHLPPPQHPPTSLPPPPNHPWPQLTQPRCPPPHRLPPPQRQAPPARIQPPANLHSLLSGFIPNWHQMPQGDIIAAIHKSPLVQKQQQQQQQQQTFPSRNNNVQYSKLSTEDRTWIKGFEEVVNRKNGMPLVEKPLKENMKVKLGEVTLLASESQILLKTLAELKAEMEQNVSTATSENWQRLIVKVEQTKDKLNSNIVQLQNPQIMKVLQNRRCKRKRLKANKKKIKEEIHSKICEWKQKEVEIDIWRERIIKREKDELKEKKLKAEADSVLNETRFKGTEASRMLQLLDALKQLRRTRTNKGDKFGYVTNSVSDNHFDTVLSILQGLVSNNLSDYKLEEATLRVMMEESGSKQSAHLSGRQDKDTALEVKMDNLLFGKNSQTLSEQLDLQSLVERRHEWDEFLTSEGNPLGSSVPVGWVVPPTDPGQYWAKFIAS